MTIERLAAGLVTMVGVYLQVGVVVSLLIHRRGLKQIDEGVAGTGLVFRLLITPGLIALWPLILRRWLAARAGKPIAPPYERPLTSASLRLIHRHAIRALAVAAPLLVITALWARGPLVPQDAPSITAGPAPVTRPATARKLTLTGELPIDLWIDADNTTLWLTIRSSLEHPGLTVYRQAKGSKTMTEIGSATSPQLLLPSQAAPGDRLVIGSSVTGEAYGEAILP